MGFILRRLALLSVMMASVAAVPMSWTPSFTAVAVSANTTALIMGGTFHPLIGPVDKPDFVREYLDNAVSGHLNPAFAQESGAVTNPVAVFTPEDFFPIGRLTFEKSLSQGLANLHSCVKAHADCVFNDDPAVHGTTAAPHVDDAMMVFGYSQSAAIASLAKRDLIAQYQPGDPSISFMLIANPMRPNGGVLMRLLGWPTIPILEIPFPGASPTESAVDEGGFAYRTVDVVRQYDGLGGDFPVRPLNLIATLNALMGYELLHGDAVDVPLSQARFQGHEGDTSYYLIETDLVALLQPFQAFIPSPVLEALDAPLRVIIEDAYDRDVGPGVPTRASWWPTKDPVGMAVKLLASIPVAVDNLVEGIGFTRVLGTVPPGTFGVGSPDPTPQPDLEPLDTTRAIAEVVVQEPVPAVTDRKTRHADDAAMAGEEGEDTAWRDEDDVEPEGTPTPEAEAEPYEESATDAGDDTTPATPDEADPADEADAVDAADPADPADNVDAADPARETSENDAADAA